jgi:hypothetical protein
MKLISEFFDVPVIGLELIDPRFYHLDTAFMPLPKGEVVYYERAFRPTAEEALAHFAIAIHDDNVMAAIPPHKPPMTASQIAFLTLELADCMKATAIAISTAAAVTAVSLSKSTAAIFNLFSLSGSEVRTTSSRSIKQ